MGIIYWWARWEMASEVETMMMTMTMTTMAEKRMV